jgi:alpha-tubulin suppressor-like RCC1 family protein
MKPNALLALALFILYSNSGSVLGQSVLSGTSAVALMPEEYQAKTVPADVTNLVGISASGHHAIALREDGRVFAWGTENFGEASIPADFTNAVGVAAGDTFSVVLRVDGTVTNLGYIDSAVVGKPALRSGVMAVSAGTDHVLTLRCDRTVAAWGGNSAGQSLPPLNNSDFVAAVAGSFHNLALKANGTVVAWGRNQNGEVEVPTYLSNAVAVAAGLSHSVALRADGTVVAWGNNDHGQTTVPLDLNEVVAIAAGDSRTLALKADGTVVSWGSSAEGMVPADLPYATGLSADGRFAVLGTASPRFTIQPWDQVVDNYQSVTLTAKVVGRAPVAFQWRFKGADIPSATQDTLTIPHAQKENMGAYTLVASNELGVAISRAATLTHSGVFNLAPFLYPQLDRTIYGMTQLVVTNAGKDANLPANRLSYQLTVAPPGATIDAQGTIRWTPSPEAVPSENVFTTVVTDDGMPPLSATNTFKVTVFEYPQGGPAEIIAGPIEYPTNRHRYYLLDKASWTNAEAKAVSLGGHLVTINDQEEHVWVRETFSKYGGINRELWTGLIDPDPSMTWVPDYMAWVYHFVWVSGQPITLFCWSTAPNSSQGVGRIKMSKPDSSWPYGQAEFAPEADWVPLNAVVEVPLDLEFITQPKSASVGIGRSTTLKVEADATTPFVYQWQFMGTNLPGETAASLIISNAQPAQAGPYCVIISNANGTLASDTVNLDVAGIVGWGSSWFGVLDVPASAMDVVGISGGGYHSLALKNDGTVIAWGRNYTGQLNVPTGLCDVVAVAAGGAFSLALKANGTVVSWGTNTSGQITMPADLANVTAIAAGGNQCLALKADGTVVAWGASSDVPAGLGGVVAIATGGGHSLALKADGTAVAWGNYAWTDVTGYIRAYVPEDLKDVVAIATGVTHALALKVDGTVASWGYDRSGLLQVPQGLSDVVAIAAGFEHSLALKADGTVVQWGNLSGNIQQPKELPNIVAIAAGRDFSLALLRDGAPHLTVEPCDITVPSGSSPKFKTKAIGKGSVSYQWHFDGKVIPGATDETYAIANAQVEDAGVYTVAVANSLGGTVSRPAELRIVGQPEVLSVNAGQLITLTNAWTAGGSSGKLMFELVSAPAGASIESETGVFTFRPPVRVAGSTNLIELRITDDGPPPTIATQYFTVIVPPLAPVSLAPLSVQSGRFTLRINGPIGPDYILQASPDLNEWADLQTNYPREMPFEVIDTPSPTNRFYRVQLGP